MARSMVELDFSLLHCRAFSCSSKLAKNDGKIANVSVPFAEGIKF